MRPFREIRNWVLRSIVKPFVPSIFSLATRPKHFIRMLKLRLEIYGAITPRRFTMVKFVGADGSRKVAKVVVSGSQVYLAVNRWATWDDPPDSFNLFKTNWVRFLQLYADYEDKLKVNDGRRAIDVLRSVAVRAQVDRVTWEEVGKIISHELT